MIVSRQRKQSVKIGTDIRVTVMNVTDEHVRLEVAYVEDGKHIETRCTLETEDRVEIPPDAVVRVLDIIGGEVRLAIDVPQGTVVQRTEIGEQSMKPKSKQSATVSPKVELSVDGVLAIGERLTVTLTDAETSGARVMIDGELIGGPDDGLKVREARELPIGGSFQVGSQVTVSLVGVKNNVATIMVVCPAHVDVVKR